MRFIDYNHVQKLGIENYPKKEYSSKVKGGLYHKCFPLHCQNVYYDVWPNRFLWDYREDIIQWVESYEEKNYVVMYDAFFEWVPGKRPYAGNDKMGLGIVYTVIKAESCSEPNFVIWNYLQNQSGEHINLEALGIIKE